MRLIDADRPKNNHRMHDREAQRKAKIMTDKQKALIESMNEFCIEKCSLSATKEEAREYISRNIGEFKLEMEVQSGMFGY